MASNRSSGLDFSDGPAPTRNPAMDHPDLTINPDGGPTYLQRNKSERHRLQGIMRPDIKPPTNQPYVPFTLKERFELWMINEGGRQLFFVAWIFLHILVAIFGFANYQLKDNSVNARATFGVTFRKS